MTPPDTNLKKQKRRHRGPLFGIAIAVLFGVGIILYWVSALFDEPAGPDTTDDTPVQSQQLDDGGPVPTPVPPEDIEQ